MNRIKQVQEKIFKKPLSAFLISNIKNIRYLTSFTGSTALLLITREEAFFFTDFRYKEQSLREIRGCTVIVPKGTLQREIGKTLKRLKITTLGFEFSAPYSLYHALKRECRLTPLKDVIEHFRIKKGKEELSLIKKAIKRAEDAFIEIKGSIRKGVTERAVALRLEEALKIKGCDYLPFEAIVASGENTAFPHAKTSNKTIKAGDLVVIDWGGEAGGYCSDMTRTLLMEGPVLEQKVEIFNTVLKANYAAIRAVNRGVTARDVDLSARELIKKAGFGVYFGHNTGHGIGLDVHEAPYISWMYKETLSEGMVFTIEPGIYIPGVGGVRIEDMVFVSEKGPKVLTHMPKRLEIIGRNNP